jgi:cell division protein ZapA
MAGRTVQVRVGGQTYRVVTTASDEELKLLAAIVDEKIAAVVPPGRAVTPQAMLLAAMALAHDLEEERARSASITHKARNVYGRMLERVDAALGEVDRVSGVAPQPLGPQALREATLSPAQGWSPVGLVGAPKPGAPANES